MSRRKDAVWTLYDIYQACDYRPYRINLRRGPLGVGWTECSHLVDLSGATYDVGNGRRSAEHTASHQALTLKRLVAHVGRIYRVPSPARKAHA